MILPIQLRGRNAGDAELLAAMETIRAIESALFDASIAGRLEGPLHVSLGEEAVAVGVAAALSATDVLLSNHRGHGHALAFGLDPWKLVAEVIGDPRGYAGGRGGSMHIFDPASGFLGTNGIVGGNAAVALGAALALQIEAQGRVAVVIIGDGAMASGGVYEAFNLAVLWRLPVLFVCANNGYAEMTPTSVHLSSTPMSRAEAFGLSAVTVDGTEAAAVKLAVAGAVERARLGEAGFVEVKCYRFGGHYVGDPARYRPVGEDAEWRDRHCPIRKLARRLGIGAAEQSRRGTVMKQQAADMLQAMAA
jgi:TPP-dependent pyruvate/acetoin dehydrogenase alpha subunit